MIPSNPDPWERAWGAPWEQPRSEGGPAQAPLEMDVKADVPAPLEQIYARHGEWLDSIALQFEDKLRKIVASATENLGAWMKVNLKTTNGLIEQTPENLAVLAKLDDQLMIFMDEAGYQKLLQEFTHQFGEQVPFLQGIVDALAAESGHSLPAVSFSADQIRFIDGLSSTAQASIQTAMEAAAGSAMQQVMFSIAGLTFKDMVAAFAAEFGGSIARNTQRAETAASIWYRTVQDLQYQKIENETGLEPLYLYAGPNDTKTRPFCRFLLSRTAKKPLSREEIDQLDNDQLPNVWVTCGGYGCRHQWLLDVRKRKPVAQQAA